MVPVIKPRLLEQLAARIGRENLLTSEADRLVYSTDVGSPPSIVDLLVKRRADAVARIHSAEDLELVVSFCRKNLIPMTPRAAATNALGGSVPKRRGIVLDLTPLNKHVAIDEKALTVTADAGVVLWDLQKRLNDVGLELPCYPTSALGATVGGFVAMDGHGIHSTRSGNIGKHVLEAEGVNPDGTRFAIRDRDTLDGIVGLGGSTAILTRIKLAVVEASADKPVLVTLKSDAAAQQLVEEATKKWRLKHVMLHNSDYFALRTEATGARKSPVTAKWGVLLVFREADASGAKDDLARIAARLGGEVADEKLAADEWALRFYPIRAKVLGPSLVAGEVFVPVSAMAAYLADLRASVSVKELSCEGHVTDDGRTYWFIFTLDDERRPTYPLGWGTAAHIVAAAKRHGGKAYHSGTWLQWESKSVFGAARYRKLKAIKKQADNRNLLNPGMVFPLPAPIPEFVYKMKVSGPTPAPSLGFQLAAGNPVLRFAGGAMKYKRAKTLGVKAADIAADQARGGAELSMFSDALWGADVPSLQAIPNPGNLPMTQTVRGKMVLALAYARSKVADPWSLKPALDVADPTPEEAKLCLDYATVQKALDAFRRAVAKEGVELNVKAVEVKVESKAAHATVAVAQKKGNVEEIKKQAAATPEPKKAWVLMADCIVCNGCQSACPTDAAIVTDTARVDRDLCIADGACFDACPTGAIRPGIEVEATSAGWPKGSRLYGKFGKAEA